MTVKVVRHKVGDTLTWQCARTDAAGNPVAVSTVEACFETLGALTVVVTNASGGVFSLTATSAETALWSSGVYRGDVSFKGPGNASTETYAMIVERGYSC